MKTGFIIARERGKFKQDYAETGNWVTKVRNKNIGKNKLNGLHNKTSLDKVNKRNCYLLLNRGNHISKQLVWIEY